jgi:hypothetical protein
MAERGGLGPTDISKRKQTYRFVLLHEIKGLSGIPASARATDTSERLNNFGRLYALRSFLR